MTNTLPLDDLRKGMPPGIPENFGGCLCDAASVCLENRLHHSGVEMKVTGALECEPLSVTWSPTSDTVQKCYADLQFATEFGAYGIAALLVSRLTDFTVFERSRKGTGFDYWLAAKESDAPLFQDKRRLEVSGLLDGEESDVKGRLKTKMTQMATGGVSLPGYGVVVHFGRPESRSALAKS